jgi:glycosyltransferase involved in cell wall biosynthesis
MSAHIAIYTDDPDRGGVAHYNHAVACALAARGHIVTLIQPRSDAPMVREREAAGVRHEWTAFDPGKEFSRSLTDTADAIACLDRANPDLVFFSDCCVVSHIAAKHIAISRGLPIVAVVHSAAPYLAERFKKCLGVIAAQHTRMREVVTVSTENLNRMHRLFGTPSTKGLVIYNGRPAQYFARSSPETRARLRGEMGIPENAVVCFTAARLTLMKGFHHLIAAAAVLKKTPMWKDLYFVWAGEGEARAELQGHIDTLGLVEHFRLLGQRWDVCDLYSAADMFALPSHCEGMPLTVMEAMARGVPVVASAVGGIAEELGDAGRLIPNPAVDPTAATRVLMDTIADWVACPTVRRAVGKCGRERAQKIFREELMLEHTFELIEAQLPQY